MRLNDFRVGTPGRAVRRRTCRLPAGRWLVAATLFAAVRSSSAAPHNRADEIRIRVLSRLHPTEVTVRCAGRVERITLSNGRLTVRATGKTTSSTGFAAGGRESVVEVECAGERRRYRGVIAVRAATDAPELFVLNDCPMEPYVTGVVGAETDAGHREPAFLQALAVVARSFALPGRRHPGYDVCDLAHCQVYRGIPDDAARVEAALRPARGIVLACARGQTPAFHLCCGGRLSAPEAVWGSDATARAVPVVDSADGRALCGQSPWSVWSSRVPADRLATVLRALRAMPPGVTPSEWRVDRTDPAGRAVTFEIVWPPGGHARVSAPALASAWGRSYDWHTLRSLLVTDIHAEGSDFVLSGRGAGHGVGLCEEGARSLARANWTMTAILGFYFPGARLAPAAPGPD